MYRRLLASRIREALDDTPVVMLIGARQTGKTTLVRDMGLYRNLDDPLTLASASSDPVGFLASLVHLNRAPIVLDEVQHVPELFPAIKMIVDADRTPGRFVLTGSAQVLLLPGVSESLAGRMEVLRLWPLSQAEIAGSGVNLVDALGGDSFEPLPPGPEARVGFEDILLRALIGGYPDPVARTSSRRRGAWFDAYVTTMLQRDIQALASIGSISAMAQLLAMLASLTATAVNVASVSRDLGVPYTTLQRYLALLQMTMLVEAIPAWSSSAAHQSARAPKLVLTDSGLAARLARIGISGSARDTVVAGRLIETFVITEILKLVGTSDTQPHVFHWRSHRRREVDVVLDYGDRIVGIEIKSSGSARSDDLAGLQCLRELVTPRPFRGIVAYAGDRAAAFGPDLWAVPIASLWEPGQTIQ
ncbi:MAG: ATP-binding protein [Chthonomonadales bacterium]|nr:ATP-binding protein [Chthonomonadales bacterium]